MPRYTHKAIEGMICDRESRTASNVYRKHMVGAVHNVEPNKNNHDEVLGTIANARRAAAEEMGDKTFLTTMDGSYYYTGNSTVVPQRNLPIAADSPFGDLYHLASSRLLNPHEKRLKKTQNASWVRGHYTHTLPSGKEVRTNIFDAIPGIGFLELKYVEPQHHQEILSHLKDVWGNAHRARSTKGKLSEIAEYEWWFFVTNPMARGGASIGTCMSATLRKSLGLPLERYRRLDYDALTLPLEDYVKMRVKEGLRAKT